MTSSKRREWWLVWANGAEVILDFDDGGKDTVHVVEATPAALASEKMQAAIENALSQFNDRECDCDGEYVDGRVVGHACYFHRIEEELRSALASADGGK